MGPIGKGAPAPPQAVAGVWSPSEWLTDAKKDPTSLQGRNGQQKLTSSLCYFTDKTNYGIKPMKNLYFNCCLCDSHCYNEPRETTTSALVRRPFLPDWVNRYTYGFRYSVRGTAIFCLH